MKNIFCPLCTSAARYIRKIQSYPHSDFVLCKCICCGLEFIDPQPSDELLGDLYKNYYEKRLSLQKRQKLSHFINLYRKLNLNLNNKNILEIGAGEGDSIVAINSLFPQAKVTALEFNKECMDFYKDIRCDLVVQKVEDWIDGNMKTKFDTIILFDVIEHLKNPVHVLEMLFKNHLAEGGILISSFPNCDSLSGKILKPFWPHYHLDHLFYFSRDSVSLIENKLDLKRVLLKPLSKNIPLYYSLSIMKNHPSHPLVKKCMDLIIKFLPKKILSLSPSLIFGEFIWIAQNNDK